jgi:glycosyltransferase involved in cell wall biosynthesis
MSADPPLVSIIVPSFNQGRFIRETLESCLAQNHRPLEILVLDGGSTDETLSILRSLGASELRWWSEPDGGVVDAVNKGLTRAAGEFVSIQSSDDLFLPGAVSAAVEALRANPAAAFAYGDVELIDAESVVLGKDAQGAFDLAAYLGRFMYVPQPGTLFSRTAAHSVGGWRAEFSFVADADFWIRLALRYPVVKVGRTVARYRYHADQRDRQRAKIARDWEGAIKDLIASGRLSARERRFAEMGICLAKYRYAPEADWTQRLRTLWAAAIANPSAVRDPRFPSRGLVPGWSSFRRLLSTLKRRLRPRGRRV